MPWWLIRHWICGHEAGGWLFGGRRAWSGYWRIVSLVACEAQEVGDAFKGCALAAVALLKLGDVQVLDAQLDLLAFSEIGRKSRCLFSEDGGA